MASRARLGAAGGSAAADVVPCRTNTSQRLSAGGWSGRKSRGLAKLCSGAERLARADWRSLQGVSEPLFETVTDGSKSDRCRGARHFRLPTVLERAVERSFPGLLRAWRMPHPVTGRDEIVHPFHLSTARTCEPLHSLRASVRLPHAVCRAGLREVFGPNPGGLRWIVGCLSLRTDRGSRRRDRQ